MHGRRIALRFGLGPLLFFIFCLAGFFAGFRYGEETGKAYWRGESQAVQIYDVADLLSFGDDETRQREFAALIARVQDAVDPSHSCWRETGGMGYVKATTTDGISRCFAPGRNIAKSSKRFSSFENSSGAKAISFNWSTTTIPPRCSRP